MNPTNRRLVLSLLEDAGMGAKRVSINLRLMTDIKMGKMLFLSGLLRAGIIKGV